MAGPEKRNVIAGPSPAPFLLIPVNNGRIVHEQTARIAPETAATEYAKTFFVSAPKYFKTDSFEINAAMAPDMKNAGIKHVATCAET
jgi:hypothetical protein